MDEASNYVSAVAIAQAYRDGKITEDDMRYHLAMLFNNEALQVRRRLGEQGWTVIPPLFANI